MSIKLVMAGAVGYVLGRTRKGKAAVRLALWAAGRDTNVKDLARSQAAKFLESEDGRKLVTQLRGPVLAGGKKAALSAYERGIGKLTEDLSHRTSELRSSLDESPAAELGGKAGALAGTLTDTLGRWGGSPTEKADSAAPTEPTGDQDRRQDHDGDRDQSRDRDRDQDREKASAGRRHGEDSGADAGRARVKAGRSGSVGREETTPDGEGDEPGHQEPARAADRRPPTRQPGFGPSADQREAASATSRQRTGTATSRSR
ncbi:MULTISPECIES: hypothetical protein [unclassified Pseudofrankia]|uniref:hypothetical protein n=1 Tax=unclassified Pseudofrankia TaxID=2994372 RepID=UPI0008DA2C20|nr:MULTISPECIES: hypothetical protein [unclassified Pseudofrankia]MDT3446371.1 hypothetical protein [Pseudofrankia sp. BMG5.37]OHV59304.1 hypothetical protein BCD48_41425 [Pseudofrankia sp. BMG5.36]